jgi:hypothetical protein
MQEWRLQRSWGSAGSAWSAAPTTTPCLWPRHAPQRPHCRAEYVHQQSAEDEPCIPHLAHMMEGDPRRTLQQQHQTEGSRAQRVEVALTQEILAALRAIAVARALRSCMGNARLSASAKRCNIPTIPPCRSRRRRCCSSPAARASATAPTSTRRQRTCSAACR